MSGRDPVTQHPDGSWWFWDEVWADELGPYKTESEARTALDAYVDQITNW